MKKRHTIFTRYNHGFKAIAYILVVIGWDILTKTITDGLNVKVLPGFFNFTSTHNTGGAWSMMSNHTWLLILLTTLFLVAFFTFNYFFKQKTKLYTIGFSLVAGGAIGNWLDRVFLSYVRDFIALDFIKFPVFNVADMCLCAGVVVLAVFFLFYYPKLTKNILKDKERYQRSNMLKLFKKDEK